METSRLIDDRIAEVGREWDRSERLLKQVELLRAEVIVPAVNELRYAGRHLIDALSVMTEDGDQALRLLDQSAEHCRRARHDAVDASVLFMSSTLESALSAFGHEALIRENPDLPDFLRELQEVRALVVQSRGDRAKRPQTYEDMEARLPRLIQFSETLRLPSRPNRKTRLAAWVAWAALLGTVGALAINLTEARSFRDLSPAFQALIAVGGALLGYLFATRRTERADD